MESHLLIPVAEKIFDIFKDHEIYLVGGSVRDFYLGKETHDFDFATGLRPEQVKEILVANGYRTHDVGWAFGTVASFDGKDEIHITTYRKDENYQRNSRKPQVEWGDTIHEDLKRRDFTVNALAMDRKGEIIDLFNGMEDLKDKILRTPIDTDRAFTDDPLRMLRALRFKARLGFIYSKDLEEGLFTNAHKVLTLSKERILEEMCKMIAGEHCYQALDDLRQYGFLPFLFPEMMGIVNLQQPPEFHCKNVWGHTILAVQNIPKDPLILRWAMLFHDLGKHATYTCTDGIIHFYRHELVSKMLAESVMRRMGFPKKWITDVLFLVENHMRPTHYDSRWSDSAVRRFVKDIGSSLDNILKISRADITSSNPAKVDEHMGSLDELCLRCEDAKNFVEIKCPVNGHDIMERFAIPAGRMVGVLKRLLIYGMIEGELPLHSEDKSVYYEYLDVKGK